MITNKIGRSRAVCYNQALRYKDPNNRYANILLALLVCLFNKKTNLIWSICDCSFFVVKFLRSEFHIFFLVRNAFRNLKLIVANLSSEKNELNLGFSFFRSKNLTFSYLQKEWWIRSSSKWDQLLPQFKTETKQKICWTKKYIFREIFFLFFHRLFLPTHATAK